MVPCSTIMRLLKNKQGLLETIIVVVIIICVLFGIMTVISEAKRVSIKNEIQGITDNAAVGALVKSVDDVAVLDEDFRVDAGAVRANFEELFNRSMAHTSNTFISNTTIRRFRVRTVDMVNSDTAIGDTRQTGGRYQAFVEVIIAADYPIKNIFDRAIMTAMHFRNILTNQDETFTDVGQARNSGRVIVRSLERVVLR